MKIVSLLLFLLFGEIANCQKISFSRLLSFYNSPSEKEMKTFAKNIGYAIDSPTKLKSSGNFDEYVYCHYMDNKLGKAAYEFFINKKGGKFYGITYSTILASDWKELTADIISNGFSVEFETNRSTYYSQDSTVVMLSHDTLKAEKTTYVRYILLIFKKKQHQKEQVTESNSDAKPLYRAIKFRSSEVAILNELDAKELPNAKWTAANFLIVFDTLNAMLKIYTEPVQKFDIIKQTASNKTSVASWFSFQVVDAQGKERELVFIMPNNATKANEGTLFVPTNSNKWIAYKLTSND